MAAAPVIFAITWTTTSLYAAVSALAVQVMILGVGLAWSGLALFSYRAWNRLARFVSKVASRWLLSVTVMLIRVTPVPMRMKDQASPGDSRQWAGITTPNDNTAGLSKPDEGRWSDVRAAAATPRARWWSALLPQLRFLSLVSTDETGHSVPDDTYTLF